MENAKKDYVVSCKIEPLDQPTAIAKKTYQHISYLWAIKNFLHFETDKQTNNPTRLKQVLRKCWVSPISMS